MYCKKKLYNLLIEQIYIRLALHAGSDFIVQILLFP